MKEVKEHAEENPTCIRKWMAGINFKVVNKTGRTLFIKLNRKGKPVLTNEVSARWAVGPFAWMEQSLTLDKFFSGAAR